MPNCRRSHSVYICVVALDYWLWRESVVESAELARKRALRFDRKKGPIVEVNVKLGYNWSSKSYLRSNVKCSSPKNRIRVESNLYRRWRVLEEAARWVIGWRSSWLWVPRATRLRSLVLWSNCMMVIVQIYIHGKRSERSVIVIQRKHGGIAVHICGRGCQIRVCLVLRLAS